MGHQGPSSIAGIGFPPGRPRTNADDGFVAEQIMAEITVLCSICHDCYIIAEIYLNVLPDAVAGHRIRQASRCAFSWMKTHY